MARDIFNFRIYWRGVDELRQKFQNVDDATAKEVVHAMVENTESLLGKSMRIAPIDEGIMVGSASAKVNQVEVAKGGTGSVPASSGGRPTSKPGRVVIGEVIYNTPYAAKQHEDLTLKHLPGRQAKYLEQPLKEFVRKYMQNLRDAVNRGMEEGTK